MAFVKPRYLFRVHYYGPAIIADIAYSDKHFILSDVKAMVRTVIIPIARTLLFMFSLTFFA
jgi:hypothetical protein